MARCSPSGRPLAGDRIGLRVVRRGHGDPVDHPARAGGDWFVRGRRPGGRGVRPGQCRRRGRPGPLDGPARPAARAARGGGRPPRRADRPRGRGRGTGADMGARALRGGRRADAAAVPGGDALALERARRGSGAPPDRVRARDDRLRGVGDDGAGIVAAIVAVASPAAAVLVGAVCASAGALGFAATTRHGAGAARRTTSAGSARLSRRRCARSSSSSARSGSRSA